MRVLITGGLGFIGSHLAKRCLSLGWDTVIVDNGKKDEHYFREKIIRKHGFVKIHRTSVKNFVISNKCQNFDVIFHLAALPSVTYSIENPYKSFKNNVDETTLMLVTETRADANIGKIVFASSAAVYGNVDTFPTLETQEKNPISPYGLQKLIGEQILAMHGALRGIDVVSLRYFNVYGPYQLTHGPYATAVSSWLHCIQNNLPLRRDGTGEQSRDMVYVEDVVSANILAATSNTKFNGESFNIASGTEISNNQILDILKQKFVFDINEAPFRLGDIMRTSPSIDKARTIFNYTPEYDFTTGLDITIEKMLTP